jgi:pyruvate,orthophosphate dikinase
MNDSKEPEKMPDCVYTLGMGKALSPQRRRELFGGKGASLVAMSQVLGLPVPDAAILTTEACRYFQRCQIDRELHAAIANAVQYLESTGSRKLGDTARPLIVSVRSAGYDSMPGMMDTILNVGTTVDYCLAAQNMEEARHRVKCLGLLLSGLIAAAQQDADGLAVQRIKTILATAETLSSRQALQDILDALQGEARGASLHTILDNARDQLLLAIESVFSSWNSHRARVYRDREGLSHDGGTAAIIQVMVFGNLNPKSGTGVVFSRNPNTGAAMPYGDFLPYAQGEEVVGGSSGSTVAVAAMRENFPEQFAQLLTALDKIEASYRDMVEVEFTIEDAALWILQARPGKRSPLAALRIAHDLSRSDSISLTPAEIRSRLDHSQLQNIRAQQLEADSSKPLAHGLGVSSGIACGAIYMTQTDAEDAVERGEKIIYVRTETAPDDVPIMAVAEGVMTSSGGVASHAAVIARAWGKPTVVGVAGMTHAADAILLSGIEIKKGELLTIDGGSGAVYAGTVAASRVADENIDTLIEWASHYLQ